MGKHVKELIVRKLQNNNCSKYNCSNRNCTTLFWKISSAQQQNVNCWQLVNLFALKHMAYGQKYARSFWIFIRKRIRKRIMNIYRPNLTYPFLSYPCLSLPNLCLSYAYPCLSYAYPCLSYA
jgi:hypothetical protein